MRKKRKFSRKEEADCKDVHRTADWEEEDPQARTAGKNLELPKW
jgi:hypothetical protein